MARALDFVHSQGHIHRDVKPANILFDGHDNAYLGDFGIIKALTADEVSARRSSSLTAPGFLLGTPSYVAPELVMGHAGEGRSDQYSLALTVHEVLAGCNYMAGLSPSATLVNQTKVDPPPLSDLLPDAPRRISDAVRRGLSKVPEERFAICAELAQEVLVEVPFGPKTPPSWTVVRELPGTVLCPPVCRAPVVARPRDEGERVRCVRCGTDAVVEVEGGTARLKVGPAYNATAMTGIAASIARGPAFREIRPRRGLAFGVLAMVVAVAAGAWFIGRGHHAAPEAGPIQVTARSSVAVGPAGPVGESVDGSRSIAPAVATPSAAPVVLNIAYGTEKKRWLEEALRTFQETPAGRLCRVVLIGKGSVEGAKAVLDGPGPTPIHVWSPASSAYRDVFEREWRSRHGNAPIITARDLALTPMVFVMWKERHDAFIRKYHDITFRTVDEAMREPEGWGSLAGKPEWGLFKFGHTDPNESNSGLVSLILMAYDYAGKQRGLSPADVTGAAFQRWLRQFERGVTPHGGSMTRSTGTLMEEMIKRGPSQYDCLFLYENLAIDYMQSARERWGEHGELHVTYSDPNIWNEHPYYILDVPWSGAPERSAATAFLDFLMSEPVQRRALAHGFRPGDPSVPVNFSESPLVKDARFGLRIEVPRMCEPPKADLVTDLLDLFRRLDR